ncbi:hypothetical protein MKZ38_004026 [Zalerion maritima]|uniref:Uncharacterized protein n=1 Tax=Zalerion maritima TaxID=339359 RepID=A0AAD5WQ81_9PEZI|nr:hypothetical protein MKZ38_004026 [Zalerion maritima]
MRVSKNHDSQVAFNWKCILIHRTQWHDHHFADLKHNIMGYAIATPEETDELFQNRVSVKGFKTYKCLSSSKRIREVAQKIFRDHQDLDEVKRHSADVGRVGRIEQV